MKEFHFDNYKEWVKDPFTIALLSRIREERHNSERSLLHYSTDAITLSKYIGKINALDDLLRLGYPELSGDEEFKLGE